MNCRIFLNAQIHLQSSIQGVQLQETRGLQRHTCGQQMCRGKLTVQRKQSRPCESMTPERTPNAEAPSATVIDLVVSFTSSTTRRKLENCRLLDLSHVHVVFDRSWAQGKASLISSTWTPMCGRTSLSGEPSQSPSWTLLFYVHIQAARS